MKLLFLGDSITDMGHSREINGFSAFDYGIGYVFCVAGELLSRPGNTYEIVNQGVSGDRIVSLYQRLKPDVWAQEPDVLTVLVGINDLQNQSIGSFEVRCFFHLPQIGDLSVRYGTPPKAPLRKG